jgi:hypothetical protein
MTSLPEAKPFASAFSTLDAASLSDAPKKIFPCLAEAN